MVIVRVGVNFQFMNKDSDVSRTVAMSCGVYLEGSLATEEDEGHNRWDLSSLVSFPGNNGERFQDTSLESTASTIFQNCPGNTFLRSGLFSIASSLVCRKTSLSIGLHQA